MTPHYEIGLPSALTVTICGGGNGAHVSAAYLGSKPGIRVNVLTRQPEKWSHTLKLQTKETSWYKKGEITGRLAKISKEPHEVIPDADVVLIALPASAHGIMLNVVSPHLKKNCILGSLFCQGGFDWAAAKALKSSTVKIDGIFGLQTIPWVCRIVEYGKEVKLIGPKKRLVLAATPSTKAIAYSYLISSLFDINTEVVPNFLTLTLSPSNQIIHPARYYSMFVDWDGVTPIPESKIQKGLYSEFDDAAASWLERLDDELQDIKNGLIKKFPNLDLSGVHPIAKRIINQYGEDVADPTNIKTIFRTNLGYKASQTPMQVSKDGLIPAVDSRLFWEDIPYGLCVLKSIAQMLQLETPSIDTMIRWHQSFMSKTFLMDNGILNPDLIHETGCPEAYGIHDLASLVAVSDLPDFVSRL